MIHVYAVKVFISLVNICEIERNPAYFDLNLTPCCLMMIVLSQNFLLICSMACLMFIKNDIGKAKIFIKIMKIQE